MELIFYRCYSCSRQEEYRNVMKVEKCICGSKTFRPSIATSWEIIFFVLKNPSYLIKAILGEE